ncbi:hypothetical protein [Marinobacter bohaiensis]|uniref:hypothetical protein n=1 Tax=Marinobacter bohaiensis TaxID=2201898 RepID=UPI000DAEF4E6|nr:hypothetical protein [Marinobacter bohaiensis]
MDTLIFNSSSIFHLYQLESQFRHRGGRHFHLADADERLELLRQCSASRDPVVQRFFHEFWERLEPEQIRALHDEGVVAEPALEDGDTPDPRSVT